MIFQHLERTEEHRVISDRIKRAVAAQDLRDRDVSFHILISLPSGDAHRGHYVDEVSISYKCFE